MKFEQQLGYYQHEVGRYYLNIFDREIDYLGVEIHEQMHASLASRSTLGLLTIALLDMQHRSATADPEVDSIAQEIIAASRVVHEGAATYVEFHIARSSGNEALFLEQLKSRPREYQVGFENAFAIESILSDERLNEFQPEYQHTIRRGMLIDISRFALNIPIFSYLNEKSQALSGPAISECLIQHNPQERWIHVLEKFQSDSHLIDRFMQVALPMFRTWITKTFGSRSESGIYTGVLYSDNLEDNLAKFYPEVFWNPLNDELEAFQSPKSPVTGESFETFLKRSHQAELQFEPALPIKLLSSYSCDSIIKKIESCEEGGEIGYYMKIIANTSDNYRHVDWGSKYDSPVLRPQESMILLHRATFDYIDGGRRRNWIYTNDIEACFLPTLSLPTVVNAIHTDDCVIVIDTDITMEGSMDLPYSLRRSTFPLFVFPSPTGSFSSFVDVCKMVTDRSLAVDVVLAGNLDYFTGVQNQSIYVTWVIPHLEQRNVLIAMMSTKLLHYAIMDFAESEEARTLAIHFPKARDITTNIKSSAFVADSHRRIYELCHISDTFWMRDPKNTQRLLGPNNADVAISHQISFGI